MSTKNNLWFVNRVADLHGRYSSLALAEFDDFKEAVSFGLMFLDSNYYKTFGCIGIAEEESDETFIEIRSSDKQEPKIGVVTKDGRFFEFRTKL